MHLTKKTMIFTNYAFRRMSKNENGLLSIEWHAFYGFLDCAKHSIKCANS